MITSASHEHDAGHPHDSEVTPNAKSVIWAAIVIFALAATIWYLLPHERPAPARPAEVIPPKPVETPRDRILSGRRPRPRRPTVETSDARRIEFVSTMQQKFAARGRSVSVDVVGTGRQVFRLRWDGKLDREHAEELKTSEGLFGQLRGLGFTSVMMQVGERIIWQKNL